MSHPPSIFDAFEASVPVLFQSVIAGMLIVVLIAWRVRASLGPDAVIPDGRFSLRNFFEIMFEGIAALARAGMLGNRTTRRSVCRYCR